MKDYRPILSDAAALVEQVVLQLEHPGVIEVEGNYEVEEVQRILDGLNDMFNQIDDELGD